MNRREMITGAGALGVSMGSLLSAGNIVPLNPTPSMTRRLTVKELQPGEIENIHRLFQEAADARNNAFEAELALKAKYGAESGVEVNFEDGYVFIRDYRNELMAKQEAETREYSNQAACQANPLYKNQHS